MLYKVIRGRVNAICATAPEMVVLRLGTEEEIGDFVVIVSIRIGIGDGDGYMTGGAY